MNQDTLLLTNMWVQIYININVDDGNISLAGRGTGCSLTAQDALCQHNFNIYIPSSIEYQLCANFSITSCCKSATVFLKQCSYSYSNSQERTLKTPHSNHFQSPIQRKVSQTKIHDNFGNIRHKASIRSVELHYVSTINVLMHQCLQLPPTSLVQFCTSSLQQINSSCFDSLLFSSFRKNFSKLESRTSCQNFYPPWSFSPEISS